MVPSGPTFDVGTGQLKPLRMCRQPLGDTASEFQADRVLNLMPHTRKSIGETQGACKSDISSRKENDCGV